MILAGRARPRPDHLIEPMKAGDLDALMEIERLCFSSPWSPQVFLDELTRPTAHIDVLRAERSVAAYCNYWHVVDEVHVLKIATHPDDRRRGLGGQLLEHVVAFAHRSSCRLLTLEVRRSNHEAQRLYRKLGFRAVGLRPGYYGDDGEDGVVMTLSFEGPVSLADRRGRSEGEP